jgi:hypothetical protein
MKSLKECWNQWKEEDKIPKLLTLDTLKRCLPEPNLQSQYWTDGHRRDSDGNSKWSNFWSKNIGGRGEKFDIDPIGARQALGRSTLIALIIGNVLVHSNVLNQDDDNREKADEDLKGNPPLIEKRFQQQYPTITAVTESVRKTCEGDTFEVRKDDNSVYDLVDKKAYYVNRTNPTEKTSIHVSSDKREGTIIDWARTYSPNQNESEKQDFEYQGGQELLGQPLYGTFQDVEHAMAQGLTRYILKKAEDCLSSSSSAE